MLLGITPLGIISVSGFHENTGIAYAQSMCSFSENMTVNCDDKWIMVYIDSPMVQKPIDEEWAGAFAVRGLAKDGEKYSICNFIHQIRNFGDENCSFRWFVLGSDKEDTCWNEVCYPIIWHEIKHLWCECNWHYGMTNKYGFTDLPEDKNV